MTTEQGSCTTNPVMILAEQSQKNIPRLHRKEAKRLSKHSMNTDRQSSPIRSHMQDSNVEQEVPRVRQEANEDRYLINKMWFYRLKTTHGLLALIPLSPPPKQCCPSEISLVIIRARLNWTGSNWFQIKYIASPSKGSMFTIDIYCLHLK